MAQVLRKDLLVKQHGTFTLDMQWDFFFFFAKQAWKCSESNSFEIYQTETPASQTSFLYNLFRRFADKYINRQKRTGKKKNPSKLCTYCIHIAHQKNVALTPVYTCIYTKAQPKSPNKSISSLDWFFSVAARMEHPNMSEWMSEPNAGNKADVSQGCQCQICHRHRVARRRRGAQPWNCSKFRP